MSNALKLSLPVFLLSLLLAATSCGSGGGSSPAAAGGPLTGNWEITLNRHASTVPLIFTGFLMQSGSSVAGSVVLGSGCPGVGPVTGTVNGQNLALTINEFGQNLSLTGTSSGGSMSGQFSTLAGGCTAFPNTGTWNAVQVTPLKGKFHGTFISSSNGTLNVTGNLTQGPNIGASTASVSGSVSGSGTVFCNYLPSSGATITGVISGTSLNLQLYNESGTLIGQIPSTLQPAIITPDATSLTGSYIFALASSNCTGDSGSVQLTFP